MPFDVSLPELLVILVAALLIFGPKRLPEMGRSLGKGLREFRNSVSGMSDSTSTEDSEGDSPAVSSVAAVEAADPDPATVKAAFEALSAEDRHSVLASLSEEADAGGSGQSSTPS